MWMMPLYLHVNQKSDYDYDDEFLSGRFSQVLLYETIELTTSIIVCTGYKSGYNICIRYDVGRVLHCSKAYVLSSSRVDTPTRKAL